IDPDLLAAADPAACRAYIELQERWMTSALPDGRVPMDELLDEKDEEFLAEWDAADADALAAIRALLDRVGDRPLPMEDRRAADRVQRAARGRAAGRRHRAVAAAGRGRGVPAGDRRLERP